MVPAAFKAVVRRAERLGCVRFARISARSKKREPAGSRFFMLDFTFAGLFDQFAGVSRTARDARIVKVL